VNEYEVIDPIFTTLANPTARVQQLYTGTLWNEGPVWFRDLDVLLWSDIPNNRIMRWAGGHTSVYRQPSGYTNGHTRDLEGRLVSCEHGGRRVSRTEHDGRIVTVADSYQGRRLNSPNDVVVKSDGTIWFTDPPYGIISDYEGHKSEREQDGNYVYCFDPKKDELKVVADDFDKPNGLAFSPDESLLYIADTGASHDPDGARHIRKFRVSDNDTLSGGEVFAVCDVGFFDGFRLDTDGRIWTSAGDGVHCYDPSGALLGKIRVPEVTANLTFGGPKRNRIFITATTSIYSVYVFVNGCQRP
jgi:gluconolactonase